MRWPPWSRSVERRASQPFTDAIVGAIAAQAAGTSTTAAATAALEAAAGAVARGFAAATVEDVEDPVADVLTPGVLALIGRDLIRRGESLFLIEVDRGGLALRPAGSWDVRGGHREADWMYRLDLFGPSGNITRFRAGRERAARPLCGRSGAALARRRAVGLGRTLWRASCRRCEGVE